MYTSTDAVVSRSATTRVHRDVTVRAGHLVAAAVGGCLLALGALVIAFWAPASGTSDALAPALLLVAGVGLWGFVTSVRVLIEHAECPDHTDRAEHYRLD